jgi:hypothetical protein
MIFRKNLGFEKVRNFRIATKKFLNVRIMRKWV